LKAATLGEQDEPAPGVVLVEGTNVLEMRSVAAAFVQ